MKRGTKRRAAEPFHNVNQTFDHSKFNFNKVKAGEVLFGVENESRLTPTSADKIIINVSINVNINVSINVSINISINVYVDVS